MFRVCISATILTAMFLSQSIGFCGTPATIEYTISDPIAGFNNKEYVPKSQALKDAIQNNCTVGAPPLTFNIVFGPETKSGNNWLYSYTYSCSFKNSYDGSVYSVGPVTTTGPLGLRCPLTGGWTRYSNPSGGYDLCGRTVTLNSGCDACAKRTPVAARPPLLGDPIFPIAGIVQEMRTDYSNQSGSLRFVRTYRSDRYKWTNNFERAVLNLSSPTAPPANACFFDSALSVCFKYGAVGSVNDIAVYRGSNRILYFSSNDQFSAAADINDRLQPKNDDAGQQMGWTVKNGETDELETYGLDGRIVSSTTVNGQTATYSYSTAMTPKNLAMSPGLLLSVTDHFGSQLRFTYDTNDRLATMIDPGGGIYLYTYDAAGNMVSVTYPDQNVIYYVYSETPYVPSSLQNRSSILSGIIDEAGNRYATFSYNINGAAVASWLADGIYKFSFNYQNPQTIVTDPLGTTRKYFYYSYNQVLGVTKYNGMSQPTSDGTSTVSSSIAYDTNGNVASITDFAGNKTTYTYDLSRNLQNTKVEASGTAFARTTTTAWHPTLYLPQQVAEPKRLTTYTYDAGGNLLIRSEQASTDANGSLGLNATLTGSPRIWTYTYNQFGQMLTVKGPRTDVNDLTTYTYDDQGNLTSITNAVGHVTTFSNYDANGRVGHITAPNGQMTELTYTPRGWLASKTVGGQYTSYTYDGVGQLTGVVLPDSSAITYTYDKAHRLTNVSDSLGNSIAYTLDAIGNRISETVNDANGVLTRKTSRVYDALNNLKTETGASQ